MKKYKVTVDMLHTIWIRGHYEYVIANSLEEAQLKVLKEKEIAFEHEYLHETLDALSKKQYVALSECDTLLPDDNWDDGIKYDVIDFPENKNYEIK